MEDRYTYRTTWSEEDEEYVGLCTEFPSLSWLAGTRDEAFRGIQAVVAETLVEMKESGETPPEPLSARKFSGEIRLRMTPQVHRRLATEAAEANVSLNRLLNAKLGAVG